MPIYEYRCSKCDAEFELLVLGSDRPRCPSCESEELEKRFSSFATGAGGSGGRARRIPVGGG